MLGNTTVRLVIKQFELYMRMKYYITWLIILVALSAKGQEENPFKIGNILFGGSISVEGHRIEKIDANNTLKVQHSERNFLGELHVGIFAYDNFVVGLKLDYALRRYKYDTGFISNYNLFLLKPFGRYYTPIGLFGEGTYGIGISETGEFGSDPLDDRKINTWSVGFGYCLLINRYVAIEPLLSYEVKNEFVRTDDSQKKFSGFTLQIGVQIFINPFNNNQNP